MIAVDTSAIIAILKREPEGASFEKLLASSDRVLMSAATYVEASVVAFGATQSPEIFALLDAVLKEFGIEIVPLDGEQVRAARRAFETFGKGRHAASLNFGDCLSYAMATIYDVPLLFKDIGFLKTGLEPTL